MMMDDIILYVKKKDASGDLPMPAYMSSQAAGMDLTADIEGSIILEPGKFKIIPTGIAVTIPYGYEAQVRPRSGLALKYGITVLNSPGTIDADYRGEVCVILINLGEKPFEIKRGDRIAQMVVSKIELVKLVEVETLPDSQRGAAGFGSTGI